MLHAAEGLAACLHHLQNQPDQPSFIMSGGDCVFDSLEQTRDRVNLQWNLWHEVWQKECSLPIEHCIGNHDCWGMGEKSDPLYGKKFALDKMHLNVPYRSWWKGIHNETANGYALVDLYDDGTFENKYIPYGWKL